MELGEVDDLDAHLLEHPHEVGLRRTRRVGDAPMAATAIAMCQWLVNVMWPGSVGEAVVVRVAEGLAEGVLGPAPREEVEDAQALLGPGRRVEPGGVLPAAGLGLPDAEPGPVLQPAMAAAGPDGREVVGQVAREEELMRRREAGHGPLRRPRPRSSGGGPRIGRSAAPLDLLAAERPSVSTQATPRQLGVAATSPHHRGYARSASAVLTTASTWTSRAPA